ncbi:MAG TPA: TspO/MBR family protein [Roseiflexaceae bacterium]|nr:TspO/MBR family protein [Roseiflexaceae bacterium]
MQSPILRQFLNIVALIAVLVVNGLAAAGVVNNKTTGELSDKYPVLTTPAGYAFSIWSIIYLGLIAFVIYQALPSQRHNPRIRGLDGLFVLNCLTNIGWILVWHYELLWLSIVLMLVILATLIMIYARLARSRSQASTAQVWVVDVPFSLYLGWISVATIVNATVVLYAAGWSGAPLAPAQWAALLLLIGALLAAFFGLRQRDPVYSAVIAWAFAAIVVKQSAMLVVGAAGVLAAVAVIVMLVALVQRLRYGPALARAA